MSKQTPVKRFTITLEGKEDGDIESAVDEVRRLIHEGYTSGFNANDSGAFHFESEEGARTLNW